MNLLFSLLHPGHVRNYESTLRALAVRGHAVHVSFVDRRGQGGVAAIQRLAADVPNLSFDWAPERADDWRAVASGVRYLADYVRYLDPRFSTARLARARMDAFLRGPARLMRHVRSLPMPVVAGLIRVCSTLERLVPTDPATDAYLARLAPDAVLASPLVDIGSRQVEIVKSALAVGVPTGACVASWDNLTSKGLLRIIPDRVFVWNESQKREAVELHLVPPGRVVATGAPRFDDWFGREPSRDAEQFRAEVGLRPRVPFLMYVCSSPFIVSSQVEARFVRRWIASLRASPEARLSEVGILVRPHPLDASAWQTEDLSRLGNVVVWPPRGADPMDEASKADYFDSLHHSCAVVGVNTSALIEAGIAGRPVYTVRSPEFLRAQEGVLHFRHLTEVAGGLLTVADDMHEHLRQLAGALDPAMRAGPRVAAFVEAFIRPHGLEVPATPLLATEIERLAARGQGSAARPRPAMRVARAALRPAARLLARRADSRHERIPRPGERDRLRPGRLARFVRRLPSRAARKSRALAGMGLSAVGLSSPPFAPSRRSAPEDGADAGALQGRRSLIDHQIASVLASADRVFGGNEPIILGPWLSEVGFELLYWIPYLRAMVERHGVDRERLIAVSRGGASAWYAGLTDNYLDVLDVISHDELRRRNEDRWARQGGQKHLTVDRFDRELVEHVKRALGVGRARVFHPKLMYELFDYAWHDRAPRSLIDRHLAIRPLAARGDLPALPGLPREYVAVRFYDSVSFPATSRNRGLVAELIETLAAQTDVVLLNSGIALDDHPEIEVVSHPRVHRLDGLMTPRNNLDVQTRAVAGARAFYGTYGGFCYLAPFVGVPAIGVYSDATKFLPVHLDVALRACAALPEGRLTVADVEDLPRLIRGAGSAATA